MTTLYNLHTDGDQYRITKFVDGDVESSYLSTEQECECPAGHRASCRHRQMIPEMVARGLVDTHWFWNFDRHEAVDINGQSKALLDNLDQLALYPNLEQPDAVGEPKLTGLQEEQILMGFHNEAVGEAQHVEEDTSHVDWDQLAEERLSQVPSEPVVRTPLPPAKWRRL